MKSFFCVVLTALWSAPSWSSGAPPPAGLWTQVDFRSIEAAPLDGEPNACLRAWFEVRRYDIRPQSGDVLAGMFTDTTQTRTLGLMSAHERCRFPEPAPMPLSNQMRTWSVTLSAQGANRWITRARPESGAGNVKLSSTEAFETRLTLVGVLIDTKGDLDDPDGALVFRPAAGPPPDFRTALESMLVRMNSGECLAVAGSLTMGAGRQDFAARVCELRRRRTPFVGNYISVRVSSSFEFDRVPKGFPALGPPSGWKRQHGVLCSFMEVFEKQELPADAILLEEGGRWRVAMLW